jgi:hypothetical protein
MDGDEPLLASTANGKFSRPPPTSHSKGCPKFRVKKCFVWARWDGLEVSYTKAHLLAAWSSHPVTCSDGVPWPLQIGAVQLLDEARTHGLLESLLHLTNPPKSTRYTGEDVQTSSVSSALTIFAWHADTET